MQAQAQKAAWINSILGNALHGAQQRQAQNAQRMPAAPVPANAPMLGSANGTPGQSYSTPQQPQQYQQPQAPQGNAFQNMIQRPGGALSFALNPNGFTNTYLKNQFPSPSPTAVLQQEAAALPPNDPRRAQIEDVIRKQGYIAPTRFTGGGYAFDPITRTFRYLPKATEGFNMQRDANGNWVESQIPGGLQATAAHSAAEANPRAAAQAQYRPFTYVGPDGVTHTTTALNAPNALGAPAVGGAPRGRGADAGSAPAPSQGAPAATGVVSGPSPGYVPAQTAVATANGKRYQQVIDQGSQAANRMNVYDNLRQVLDSGTKTGYGTEWQNHALSFIMNTPILGNMIPASERNKAINYQVAMKYIAQGTLQRFHGQPGTGTDSQLAAVAHGNTNPDQLAGAMKVVTRYLESQDMADLAKANAQKAWAAQNNYDYSKQDRFENVWREHNNPLAFQYKSATPEGKQEILKGLTDKQKIKLSNDIQWLSPYLTITPAGQ